MECPANTFTGIHVYRDSAIGPACKHCHGMKRAIEGQDRALSAQPAWRERAETALADLIASGEPFTSEDITTTVGLPKGRIESNGNNAVGALVAHARREGLIQSAGRRPSRNPRSYGAMIVVWIGR